MIDPGTRTTGTTIPDYSLIVGGVPIEITLSEKTITDLRMIAFQLTDSIKEALKETPTEQINE